jgi:hypothetical protein
MKHQPFTSVHQSLSFSRRMMLVGGGQAAIGGLLLGRLGISRSPRTKNTSCCPRTIGCS